MGQKAEWKVLKQNAEPLKNEATTVADESSSSQVIEEEESANTEVIKPSSPRPESRPRDYNRNNADSTGAKVVPETECVQRVKFPEMQETPLSKQALDKIDYLRDVDLEVSVELGNAVLSINNILGLDIGSVIELNQTVGEEVRILINGNAYASGEVVVIGEKFGVRILKIIHEQDN